MINMKTEAVYFSETLVNGVTFQKEVILIYTAVSTQVRLKYIAKYTAACSSHWGGGGAAKMVVVFEPSCQTYSACILHLHCQFSITSQKGQQMNFCIGLRDVFYRLFEKVKE